MPTWSLVIPTYNRRDVLLRVLPLALRQTVPPIQVVIVDSSQDWDVTRQAVQGVAADHPGIRLDYLQATTPSSATQRNQGVEQAIGDIVVMIDDDSFLYPDYVERILAVYAADADGVVAGVYKNAGPLSYLRVYGAGHLVPAYGVSPRPRSAKFTDLTSRVA